MNFNKIIKIPFRIFKKIIGKIFRAIKNEGQFFNVQIEIGSDSSIDPSALFITTENGNIKLSGNNYIGRNVEIGTNGKIVFGKHTSIQDRCIILGDVEIGNYCLFATNVYISSGRHYYDYLPEYNIKDQDRIVQEDAELKLLHSKKVVIEDDCWIGINVVIMSGITIGKGAVIGANSVVTKNVEAYTIVAGSPAKVIKKRLAFYPKNEILYQNIKDLAYFYKGFFTDKKNLDIDFTEGGIAASTNFTIYAESRNTRELKIELKKNVAYDLEIHYCNQNKVMKLFKLFEMVIK